MSSRSRSFQKRQKELARLEKRRIKIAARLQRKQEKRAPGDAEASDTADAGEALDGSEIAPAVVSQGDNS